MLARQADIMFFFLNCRHVVFTDRHFVADMDALLTDVEVVNPVEVPNHEIDVMEDDEDEFAPMRISRKGQDHLSDLDTNTDASCRDRSCLFSSSVVLLSIRVFCNFIAMTGQRGSRVIAQYERDHHPS